MDFDTRVGAYGVILRGEPGEESLLLSLWDGPVEPVWTLPGGGMEPGEDPEGTCLREVEEETGYLIALTGLLGVTSRTISAAERLHRRAVPLVAVQVIYRAEVLSGVLRPEADGSSIDAAWLAVADLGGDGTHRVAHNVYRALELAGVPQGEHL